jgi:hypothetical protein
VCARARVCVAGCVAFCTATGLQIRNYAGELRFIGSELDETQDSTPLDTALRDLAPADLPMDPAIWHLGPVLQGGGVRSLSHGPITCTTPCSTSMHTLFSSTHIHFMDSFHLMPRFRCMANAYSL